LASPDTKYIVRYGEKVCNYFETSYLLQRRISTNLLFRAVTFEQAFRQSKRRVGLSEGIEGGKKVDGGYRKEC